MPDDLLPAWRELHPHNVYLTELEHAVGLHQAASELCLLRNRQTKQFYSDIPEEMLKQRAGMLDIAERLVINNRNSALDKFCMSWCKLRNLKP